MSGSRQRHGKGKALSVLAAKLARAVYYMLRAGQVFDETSSTRIDSEPAGELDA